MSAEATRIAAVSWLNELGMSAEHRLFDHYLDIAEELILGARDFVRAGQALNEGSVQYQPRLDNDGTDGGFDELAANVYRSQARLDAVGRTLNNPRQKEWFRFEEEVRRLVEKLDRDRENGSRNERKYDHDLVREEDQKLVAGGVVGIAARNKELKKLGFKYSPKHFKRIRDEKTRT